MKGNIICLAAAAVSMAVGTAATSVVAPADLEPRSFDGMLQLGVERVKRSEAGPVRRDVVPVSLDNYQDVAYIASIRLGTPAQTLQVQLDTGSSDLWVQASTNPYCTSSQGNCQDSGTFDASSSSSFNQLQKDPFDISYVDTTGASGTYATDTLAIGNATLDNFIFGYAENSNTSLGVLGVSFTIDEDSNQTYPNLPYRLQQDGIIDLVSYSLWLNDLDANTGSILFGGIDTGKFTGELSVIPMYPVATIDNITYYSGFNVELTGITVTSSSNANNKTVVYGTADALVTGGSTIYTILDSGTSLGTFPLQILTGIVEGLGLADSAQYSRQYQFYQVDCSVMNSDALVVFEFGGKASIAVTMDQFIQVMSTDSFGDNVCGIALQASETLYSYSETFIVGDTILRSAYVVYDLQNYMIGLAQTSFNSSVTSLLSLSSSGIPDGLTGKGADNSENQSAASSDITTSSPTSTSASATSAATTSAEAPSLSVSTLSIGQRSTTASSLTGTSKAPVPTSGATAFVSPSVLSVVMTVAFTFGALWI
ncbi:aspartic peptidase domain-containing protein [Lipomyces kononenkoae]|uniref:Aspartic peptidase domain-containing protein n=1 Tax=Lipomyces kononenkoae TaxID=34357 RepID=A0ACC3SX46_LIPKO